MPPCSGHTAWPGRSGQRAQRLPLGDCALQRPSASLQTQRGLRTAAHRFHPCGWCNLSETSWLLPVLGLCHCPAGRKTSQTSQTALPNKWRAKQQPSHLSELSSASSTLLARKLLSTLVHEPPPDAATRSSGVRWGLSCCGFTSISLHPNPLHWGWIFFFVCRGSPATAFHQCGNF